MDVNIRTVIGFHEIGCGYAGIKHFSRCMNLHCISENGFIIVNNQVMDAYRDAATISMKKAANELKIDKDVVIPTHTRVTIDGSWQRRGHNSLNGLVTAIAAEKCVDVEVLSKQVLKSFNLTGNITCTKSLL